MTNGTHVLITAPQSVQVSVIPLALITHKMGVALTATASSACRKQEMSREFAIVLSLAASFCGEAKPVAVTPCEEYNSWPMIQAVDNNLICAYIRSWR